MFPLTYKDVLPVRRIVEAYNSLDGKWTLNNQTTMEDMGRFWTIGEKNLPEHIDLALRVKMRVMKDLKRQIRLCRIQVNGQTTTSGSAFHWDYPEEDVWTFVLFTSPCWHPDWGGEFVCLDPQTEELKYVTYVPNSGVLIPSKWLHKGCSPNHKTQLLRTSIAFSYVAEEKFSSMALSYPELLHYR